MDILWPDIREFPSLPPDEAHVFAVPVEQRPAIDELSATLSVEERLRAEQFRLDAPHRRFIVGRAMLRVLLGRFLDLPAAEIALRDGEGGKPELAEPVGSSTLRFNVAHSDEMALVAMTHGCEIGVDVERVRAVDYWEQIAHRYFHPAETIAILASKTQERSKAFLQCWTAKEAVLKALGVGLGGSLSAFEVPVGDHHGQWVQMKSGSTCPETNVWLQSLAPHLDYVAAVALAAEKRRVRCFAFRG